MKVWHRSKCKGALLAMAFMVVCSAGKAQDNQIMQCIVQQIGKLQVYLGYIKKGFTIAHDGLQVVHDIKNGEFNLHNSYYNSLTTVNPYILQNGKVAELAANQATIAKKINDIIAYAKSSGEFSGEETSYFSETFSQLLDEVNATLDAATQVSTDGKLQMTDDERIQRLNVLYAQAVKQRTSTEQMARDIQSIAIQRLMEAAEIRALQGQY